MSLIKTPEQELAQWIVETDFKDIPSGYINDIKFDIIDTLGCGIYGSTSVHATIVRNLITSFGMKSISVIWGTNLRASSPHAAMANEMSVHAYDFDDCGGGGHAGGPVLGSALAVAEELGSVSGKELLTAIALGFETGTRVSNASGPFRDIMLRGWYNPGIFVAFGSVAAAGKILGLDENEMTRALAICGASATGLYSATNTKRYCTARNVQNAIYAALLAKGGLDAPLNGLTADYSGFITTISDKPDPTVLTKDIGKWPEKLSFRYKFYPTVFSNQSTIHSLAALMKEHSEIKPELIDKVTLGTDKVSVVYTTGECLIPKVDTPGAALISISFCGAAQLLLGDVNLDLMADPEIIRNPSLQKLMRKFVVVVDEEIDKMAVDTGRRFGIRTTILLKDGRSFNKHIRAQDLRGTRNNPMKKEEMLEKFRNQSLRVINEESVEDIIKTVEGLEKLSDVSQLSNLLVP